MKQGDPWYLSGVFWAIAAVVVAVVLGIAAVWATFRSANPRRRLYIYLDKALPVVSTHEALQDAIQVRHLGRTLLQPYLVTLTVISRGRRDIPSSSFDGGKPIVANLGVPIIRLLEEKSLKSKVASLPPKSSVDGTRIRIGPSMLSRQHVLTYTALVEGEPNLTTEVALLDVDVLEERPSLSSIRWRPGGETGGQRSVSDIALLTVAGTMGLLMIASVLILLGALLSFVVGEIF